MSAIWSIVAGHLAGVFASLPTVALISKHILFQTLALTNLICYGPIRFLKWFAFEPLGKTRYVV